MLQFMTSGLKQRNALIHLVYFLSLAVLIGGAKLSDKSPSQREHHAPLPGNISQDSAYQVSVDTLEEFARDSYLHEADLFDNEGFELSTHGNLTPAEFVIYEDSFQRLFLPIDFTGRFDLLNPDLSPEGTPFVEGDMVMMDGQHLHDDGLNLERKFVSDIDHLWPTNPMTGMPFVPYVITESAQVVKDVILDAISVWEKETCITFHLRNETGEASISSGNRRNSRDESLDNVTTEGPNEKSCDKEQCETLEEEKGIKTNSGTKDNETTHRPKSKTFNISLKNAGKELTVKNVLPYIRFIRHQGCWSYVGRQHERPGGQALSVGRGCSRLGTVVHEIGHALGLMHEQSRSDRDDYVMVVWDNIKPEKRVNFKKRVSMNAGIPYDYSSVMHYGGYFFSEFGAPTLMTKNPYHQRHLGQRIKLTFRDVLAVNNIYDCVGKWKQNCGSKAVTCKNGGYLGKTCTCRCPPGTVGDVCESITHDYYPSLECGGNVTSPQNISSPNYPKSFPADTWCMWWAQAGSCQKARLTVNDFELLFRHHGRCPWDILEIRTEDPIMPGKVYCSKDILPGQQFYSKKRELFLSFRGMYSFTKGFTAFIDFVEDPDCKREDQEINSIP